MRAQRRETVSEGFARLIAARRAVSEQPDFLPAQVELGHLSAQIGDLRGAIAAFEAASRLAADDARTLRRLADAYRRGGRAKEALLTADLAAQREPLSAESYLCLGDALLANEATFGADRMYGRALAIDPMSAPAECGRGAVHLIRARWHEARAAFERALVLDPGYPEARYQRALIDLRFGDYRAGYAGYPSIMRTVEQRPRYYYFHAGVPVWDGTPLGNRRLVVAYDQGIGNLIMMVRFFNELLRYGSEIAIEAPPALLALLRRSFPNLNVVGFTHWQPLDAMDVHVPAMQLPVALNVVDETAIAAHVPYLTADPARVAALRARLQLESGVRHIGIAWHGNRANARDRWRAAPLPRWAPLAAVAGVRFHSLQFGATPDELAAAPFPIAPAHELIEDMEDTAAFASLMDLIVSVDTSVAHLAGALALPVWMPDSLVSDYRWGTGRTGSPWYPTLRIFRQREIDAWEPVFEEIAAALGIDAANAS